MDSSCGDDESSQGFVDAVDEDFSGADAVACQAGGAHTDGTHDESDSDGSFQFDNGHRNHAASADESLQLSRAANPDEAIDESGTEVGHTMREASASGSAPSPHFQAGGRAHISTSLSLNHTDVDSSSDSEQPLPSRGALTPRTPAQLAKAESVRKRIAALRLARDRKRMETDGAVYSGVSTPQVDNSAPIASTQSAIRAKPQLSIDTLAESTIPTASSSGTPHRLRWMRDSAAPASAESGPAASKWRFAALSRSVKAAMGAAQLFSSRRPSKTTTTDDTTDAASENRGLGQGGDDQRMCSETYPDTSTAADNVVTSAEPRAGSGQSAAATPSTIITDVGLYGVDFTRYNATTTNLLQECRICVHVSAAMFSSKTPLTKGMSANIELGIDGVWHGSNLGAFTLERSEVQEAAAGWICYSGSDRATWISTGSLGDYRLRMQVFKTTMWSKKPQLCFSTRETSLLEVLYKAEHSIGPGSELPEHGTRIDLAVTEDGQLEARTLSLPVFRCSETQRRLSSVGFLGQISSPGVPSGRSMSTTLSQQVGMVCFALAFRTTC